MIDFQLNKKAAPHGAANANLDNPLEKWGALVGWMTDKSNAKVRIFSDGASQI